jgi:2-oxoglutarate dehydrogenase E1 component
MIPALEQIIKRGGALGVQRDRASAWPIAAASTCWRNVMDKPYRAIFHEFQGGSVDADDVRGLGRREVSPGRLVRPRVRRQRGAPVADRQPLAIWKSSIPVVLGKARAKQDHARRDADDATVR